MYAGDHARDCNDRRQPGQHRAQRRQHVPHRCRDRRCREAVAAGHALTDFIFWEQRYKAIFCVGAWAVNGCAQGRAHHKRCCRDHRCDPQLRPHGVPRQPGQQAEIQQIHCCHSPYTDSPQHLFCGRAGVEPADHCPVLLRVHGQTSLVYKFIQYKDNTAQKGCQTPRHTI